MICILTRVLCYLLFYCCEKRHGQISGRGSSFWLMVPECWVSGDLAASSRHGSRKLSAHTPVTDLQRMANWMESKTTYSQSPLQWHTFSNKPTPPKSLQTVPTTGKKVFTCQTFLSQPLHHHSVEIFLKNKNKKNSSPNMIFYSVNLQMREKGNIIFGKQWSWNPVLKFSE